MVAQHPVRGVLELWDLRIVRMLDRLYSINTAVYFTSIVCFYLLCMVYGAEQNTRIQINVETTKYYPVAVIATQLKIRHLKISYELQKVDYMTGYQQWPH